MAQRGTLKITPEKAKTCSFSVRRNHRRENRLERPIPVQTGYWNEMYVSSASFLCEETKRRKPTGQRREGSEVPKIHKYGGLPPIVLNVGYIFLEHLIRRRTALSWRNTPGGNLD
jgi:hypothetical protein